MEMNYLMRLMACTYKVNLNYKKYHLYSGGNKQWNYL